MNVKSRQEMGLVWAGVGQGGSSREEGKVDAFSVCSGGRAHWTCQGLAVGQRLHREAVGSPLKEQ